MKYFSVMLLSYNLGSFLVNPKTFFWFIIWFSIFFSWILLCFREYKLSSVLAETAASNCLPSTFLKEAFYFYLNIIHFCLSDFLRLLQQLPAWILRSSDAGGLGGSKEVGSGEAGSGGEGEGGNCGQVDRLQDWWTFALI